MVVTLKYFYSKMTYIDDLGILHIYVGCVEIIGISNSMYNRTCLWNEKFEMKWNLELRMKLEVWNLELVFRNDMLGSTGFGTLVYPE